MTDLDLLPCPFCGDEADVSEDEPGSWTAHCTPIPEGGCGVTNGYYTSKIAAINAWNRRALSSSSAPIAAVKELEWHETEDEDGIWAWEAHPHRYEIFHQASDVDTRGIQLAYNREILGFWPSLDDAKNAATAHYRALASIPAPTGWRLVPEWPTAEMIDAAAESHRSEEGLSYIDVYQAMLAAAPTSGSAR